MVITPPPIKGAGQYLRVFEQTITYISTNNVEPDDDGYVRGSRTEEFELKAAVVPTTEEDLSINDYGENFNGLRAVYIRRQSQEDMNDDIEDSSDVVINADGYFKIDDKEWKIISVDDYGTVIKVICGLSEVGGYPVG